jgi:hypothetical protein
VAEAPEDIPQIATLDKCPVPASWGTDQPPPSQGATDAGACQPMCTELVCLATVTARELQFEACENLELDSAEVASEPMFYVLIFSILAVVLVVGGIAGMQRRRRNDDW